MELPRIVPQGRDKDNFVISKARLTAVKLLASSTILVVAPRSVPCRQFARNQNFLNFIRAVVNLKDPCVAVIFFDWIIMEIPVTAKHLNRRRTHALAHLRSEELRH